MTVIRSVQRAFHVLRTSDAVSPVGATQVLVSLLLFVLAGVFTQGARMRTDLEGTV